MSHGSAIGGNGGGGKAGGGLLSFFVLSVTDRISY